jgi:hypothetical protein
MRAHGFAGKPPARLVSSRTVFAPDPFRRNAVPRLACIAIVLAAVVFGTAFRIGATYASPHFQRERAEGMLKSDPALLYYFAQRIVESGGRPPPDLRHDPRIEHPLGTDLAAHFPIAQEYLVAWTHLALGELVPLHVVAVWVMSLVASLAAVGVFGLALELTGRLGPAALATAFFALSPSSYRTLGFVLLGEDASLPCFALHAWLLARACRVRSAGAFALAGLALGAAVATWHAMPFVVAVEAACLFAWAVRSGENVLALPGAWALPAVYALFGVVSPVLRAHGLLLSIPMQIFAALLLLRAIEARGALGLVRRAAVALAAWALFLGVATAISRATNSALSDYAHVFELMAAKLRWLGERPDDPRALSFGARLLWQGPFETAAVREILAGSLVAALLAGPAALDAAVAWWRGRGDGRFAVVAAFAVASAFLAKLIRRNLALTALALPVAAVVALARRDLHRDPRWSIGLVLVQLVCFASVMQGRQDGWYSAEERSEIASLVDWMRANLPDDGAVASDFVVSAAVLAHTGHPIALQPKYEITVSRDRIEEFLRAFFAGSRADLHALLARWECRYLLVDREALWGLRYIAGLPLALADPVPATAAAAFLSTDWARASNVQGFRLLHRTPRDRYLLYEVE